MSSFGRETTEHKHSRLADQLSETGVLKLSKTLQSQSTLTSMLSRLNMLAHRAAADTPTDTLTDRLESVALQVQSLGSEIDASERYIENSIASVLDLIDTMITRQAESGSKAIKNMDTAADEDLINTRKTFTEESRVRVDIVKASLLDTADTLYAIDRSLDKEHSDFGKCQGKILNQVICQLDGVENEFNRERMVRKETTNRIKAIIGETHQQLDAQFKEEQAAQIKYKDSMKKLIHTIKYRLQDE